MTTQAEAQGGLVAVRIAAADSEVSQEYQPQKEWFELRQLLRRKQFRN